MLNKGKGILILFVTVIFATSCNKYNKLLKSNDVELKYKAANEYYEKKAYTKAIPLYDELLITLKGDRRFEEVYYKYAYSRYGIGEIVMASYHFYNFYESFPVSKWAEDALFMHVYCDYLDSYPYYLDPTVTQKAMNSLQLFINVYPQSVKVAECNKYMDELRGRLRKKSLESAYLFLKVEDFKAATIAFKNTLKDYPELENKNEIEFLIVKCSYQLAVNSVDSKQEERFRDVCKAYAEYVENNGTNDRYHPQAAEYDRKARRQIQQIPVKIAFNLLAVRDYQGAVDAFKNCLQINDLENKEKVQFGLVQSHYSAGVNSVDRTKQYHLQQAIVESDNYIGTFGLNGPSYKKVKKLRNKAARKLEQAN